MSTRRQATVAAAAPDDAGALAALHADCFEQGWPAGAIAGFLADPACVALLARAGAGSEPAGLVIARQAADEAEILTLAVAPAMRCRGVGRALLAALFPVLAARGVVRVMLEVGVTNHAADALYRKLGFRPAGRRKGYYGGGGAGEDAAVLRLDLPSG